MKRLPRTLDAVEIRVLGALLEKEQATPDYYPMTVRAVAQAASQKTNREPVMALDETDTQAALDRLFQEDVLAWRSRGSRTVKWKHNVERRWALASGTKAILTLLMLRGPQTLGELRSRAERLHAFADLGAVEAALQALAAGDEPLARELPRGPGQKESRWAHCLAHGERHQHGQVHVADSEPDPIRRPDRIERLEARVAELERAVRHLTDDREETTA
jgi:uncharacterized protein YceH (UPF0502 family)